jgi:hypothetical protein
METGMSTKFKSKIDWWIFIPIIMLGIFHLFLLTILRQIPPQELSFVVIILGAVDVLIIWTVFGTTYEIGDTTLSIKSGPFRWKIPVKEIRSITPSNSPLSGPAVSLDRLEITYGPKNRSILVSPADKEGFIAEIEKQKGS